MTPHLESSRTLAVATVALVALSLGAAGCRRPAAEPEAATARATKSDRPAEVHLDAAQLTTVRTAEVVAAPFAPVVEATGTVQFDQNRSTQVLAPLSGPVTKLLVQVGDRVRQGQPLAAVTSPDFTAAVSALRKAQSEATNARRIADMDRQLFDNDAIARRDLEQAETDAAGAEADRDAAVEQLRALGIDAATIEALRQGKATGAPAGEIRSPISGTLVERLISPGQLLEAGSTPCFTVADLSRVWVLANVFAGELPEVAVGDPAEVVVGSGAPIEGTVDNIAAFVDPNTRAIAVRLSVPNPGEVLKRDLYVRVRIRSRRQASGLMVPVSAVLRDEEDLPYVFVAGPDGTFARRRIEVGIRSGDRYEVARGLAAGDSVVVEGGLFLESSEAH